MQFLFRKLILTVGLVVGVGIAPAQAQLSDVQLGVLVDALNQANTETGGEPRPLSEWQTENIPRWSKQCMGRSLTPEQFTTSPVTARWVSICTLRDIVKTEYRLSGKNEAIALRRSAAWWVSGNPGRYNSGETAAYTQKVLSLYRQKNPSPAKVATASTPTPKPSSAPTPASVSNASGNNSDNTTPTSNSPVAQSSPAAPSAPAAKLVTFYDRYMQAGYEATNRRDNPTALIYFKRALDERPDDAYATQAIRNVERYLAQPAPPPAIASTPAVVVPPLKNSAPTRSTPVPSVTAPAPTQPAPAKTPAKTTTVSTKPATPTKLTPPKNLPPVQPAPPSAKAPTAVVVIPAAPTSDAFNQQQAIALVTRWLQAKPEVFAPPYDQQQIADLTTGELLASLVRPNGVLTWLKTNGGYFRYGVQTVDSVERFVVARERATMEVNLTEDRTLYLNGAIDPTRTDFSSQRVRFTFSLDNGTWKIADYKTVSGSLLERSILTPTPTIPR